MDTPKTTPKNCLKVKDKRFLTVVNDFIEHRQSKISWGF